MAISRHAHKINSCQKKCHRGRDFFSPRYYYYYFSGRKCCKMHSFLIVDDKVITYLTHKFFFLYFLNKKVERIVKLYSLANSMEICVTFHLIGKKHFTFYFTYILWFWLDSMSFPLCRIHLFLTDRSAVKCVIKKPYLFFVWIQWKLVKL